MNPAKPSPRILRFDSIPALLAEVDRLAELDRAGSLQHLGNWPLGQTLGHLAIWAEYAYKPVPLKPPFFVRWYFRLRKKHLLSAPMKGGARIPGVQGGTLGTDPMPLDEALPRFRQAMQRIAAEAPTLPNVIFGKLAHDEWIALQLRHSELHLGFLKAKE